MCDKGKPYQVILHKIDAQLRVGPLLEGFIKAIYRLVPRQVAVRNHDRIPHIFDPLSHRNLLLCRGQT
jgi:hypothetical protein